MENSNSERQGKTNEYRRVHWFCPMDEEHNRELLNNFLLRGENFEVDNILKLMLFKQR